MNTELAIIGAGPAGLAAAEIAAARGIDTVVVDEQARPGGQISRQPPADFAVENWLPGGIYKPVKQLLAGAGAPGATRWLPQTTVLALQHDPAAPLPHRYRLLLNNAGNTSELEASCVLIAPGCYDMPVIFPGSNLPGVMAAGGIQAFVKSQQLIPGERFLFVGSHPLQLIVADQILQAGGQVAGVVFAQRLSALWSLLKSAPLFIRHGAKMVYFTRALIRLLLKRVPIYFSRTVVQAHGDQQLQNVDIAAIDSSGTIQAGSRRNIDCDRLGICFGFLASSELARQVGARGRWSAAGGGWIIDHDPWMSTDLPGLYVAGEITGVAGADASICEGRLAGLGIARELQKIDATSAARLAQRTRTQLKSANLFAAKLLDLSYPGRKLLQQLMTEQSMLCKCEEVSVADFAQCLAENPFINDANAAKLLSRAGMGLCQGRYCHYHIAGLLAETRGIRERQIKPFNARFPAKPLTIKSLLDKRDDQLP